MNKYDLVIAGAGVAGLSLALKAVEKGMKVALADTKKRESLGHDWSDSIETGAFNDQLIDLLPSEESSKPNGLRLISPLRSKEYKIHYDYKIVDRKLFETRLLDKAEKMGVAFFDTVEEVHPVQNESLRCTGLTFMKDKEEISLVSDFVADCTGIGGAIRNQLNGFKFNHQLKQTDTSYAYREVHIWEGKPGESSDNWLTYIYSINGGYRWINYENGKRVDIGCGIQNGKGYELPDENVRIRIKENKMIGKFIRGGGGKIPIRAPLPCLYTKGLILIGDSAYQAIPTSGCGAGNSIMAGLMAGEAISKSELSPDERGYLYQKNYYRNRGADLAYYDVLRRKMQSCTPRTVDWLMNKGILGKEELWGSIHGIYKEPQALSMLPKLFRGLVKLQVLIDLQSAMKLAVSVRNHLINLPNNIDEIPEWQAEYVGFLNRMDNI